MTKLKQKLVLTMAAVALASCSTSDVKVLNDTRDLSTDDLYRETIKQTRAIQRTVGVTSQLSSLAHGEKPVLELERLNPSLRRVRRFPGGYEGLLDSLLRSLAMESGYRFLPPAGKKPIGGTPIVIADDFMTVGEMIFDAGMQAGSCALVVVDEVNTTIQVIYNGC